MNGLPLALGVVGGLAALSLRTKAGKAGGTNKRPGRFRRTPVPTGFTASPMSFVANTVLDEIIDPDMTGKPVAGTGLYHVTTHLPSVLADGKLLSRVQLRAVNRQGAGLGGGIMDEAPDHISVGLRLPGALRVLRGMRMMAQAVHGQIEAKDALAIMKDISDDATSALNSAADWMLDNEDTEDPTYLAAKSYEDDLARAERKVLAAKPGPALYTALKKWEGIVAETTGNWIAEGHISDDEQTCFATVGFTEPAERFQRVHPENIGLLQLAARKGAKAMLVPQECEVRFRPEALAIVGVWEGE